MKTLLLISYFFPPIQSPESIMALNSVKYLSDLGWNTIVVSARRSKTDPIDLSTSSNIPDNISVYRTYSIENIIFKIFQRIGIIPDVKIGWLPFSFEISQKILQERKIDVIVSRSAPITSHLVALKLKLLTKLPWIACFSDPWTQNPYWANKFYIKIKKFDENLEKKILSVADKIIVTTEQTKELFMEKYKIDEKIIVIPNSYDPSDFLDKVNAEKEDKFVITYTGNFYGPRSPEPFLKALKLLDKERGIDSKIKVKLIGLIGKFRGLISRYQLESVVQVIDTLPRKNTIDHLFLSDVLLLIDAPNDKESVFLPSKLLDYINIKKPILAIVPRGPSADVVRLTKTGIIVSPEDINGIKNAIKHYYELYKNSKLEINPDWKEIEKYSAKNYAKILVNTIEKLIT